MKLSLAISNLVDNAVKYTPEEGTVKVSLDADHQNVFISVADTGIGIPEDEVNRIFERFYRVDKTRDRETGGTGLGLSITHSTIMMHKGSIKVNSKEEGRHDHSGADSSQAADHTRVKEEFYDTTKIFGAKADCPVYCAGHTDSLFRSGI